MDNIKLILHSRSNAGIRKALRSGEINCRFPGALEKLDGGWESKCSFLFADLCGFTAMCEQEWARNTRAVVRVLNVFHKAASKTVLTHNGIVDKYIGDCVLDCFAGSGTTGAVA